MDAATNDPENVPEVDDCDSDEKLSFDKVGHIVLPQMPICAAQPGHQVTVNADISRLQNAVSSTKSVSSSILNYRIENGRSYHAFRDGSKSERT